MDIAKLLQALEEMIFEVACLAVLLPKTFFFLALFPARTQRYLAEELAKKREDRFDGFASPLIMWAVCGILPNSSSLASSPPIPKFENCWRRAARTCCRSCSICLRKRGSPL